MILQIAIEDVSKVIIAYQYQLQYLRRKNKKMHYKRRILCIIMSRRLEVKHVPTPSITQIFVRFEMVMFKLFKLFLTLVFKNDEFFRCIQTIDNNVICERWRYCVAFGIRLVWVVFKNKHKFKFNTKFRSLFLGTFFGRTKSCNLVIFTSNTWYKM